MDIFLDLNFWQYVLVAVAVVICIITAIKNKTIYAKLAVLAVITLVVLLQLCKTPDYKETPLDSRIRQEREALASYAGSDGVDPELEKVVTSLGELNVSLDKNNPEYVKPLLDKIAAMKFPQENMQKTAKSFVSAWTTRMENTPDMLKKKIAALEAKKDKTPEEAVEEAQLRGMIQPWYNKLPLKFGLDLVGGTEVRLRLLPDYTKLNKLQDELTALKNDPAAEKSKIDELTKKVEDEKSLVKQNFDNASEVIRSRLNTSGLEEISVNVQGNDKLLIQMPGMSSTSAQRIINLLKKMGQLQFRLVVPAQGAGSDNALVTQMSRLGGKEDKKNFSRRLGRFLNKDEIKIGDKYNTDMYGDPLYDWLHTDNGEGLVVIQEAHLTGDYITTASANQSTQHPGSYEIAFRLSPTGGLIFNQLTGNNIGRRLAIVLDGKLKSAPTIQSAIANQGTITGNFTADEAKNLEVVLKSGSLKTQVEVEFENTVGPSLGEDSIRSGVTAMLIGMALVLLFMLVYYQVAGVVTDIILFINMLLIVALLSGLDATLTLPGIAGLILTIGMAVDANVLIFERIREERIKGNTLARSIQLGYERAFVTIVDANVTTFITALILHQFGTEAVKGFAITLIIGIICSVFTSLVLTRWCFEAMLEFGWIKELKMMQFFKRPSISFSKLRRPAMLISLICIIIGMVVVIGRGKKNLSQDFTGGLFAQIELKEPMSAAEFRDKLAPITKEFPDLTMQTYGQDNGGKFNEYILRTSSVQSPGDTSEKNMALKTSEELKSMIEKDFPLVKNGLLVGENRIKEKSTDGIAVFQIDLSTRSDIEPAKLKKTLEDYSSLQNVEVVPGDDNKSVTVYAGLPTVELDGTTIDDVTLNSMVREQVQKLRDQGMLSFTDPFPRFNFIGGSVASEMIRQAILALIFSMVAIFIYIWLRFQFKISFGAGAVIALAHDVLFTVGALAVADSLGILNGQISLTVVAALLTLVGYSLNDTIVVFDRIRENLGTSTQEFDATIDVSLNQTLSRTIVTSMTTILVVLALLIFGGEVIRGFSFALFIGIFVGTYSSIFIASPILIEFAHWANKRRLIKAKKKLNS